MHHLVQLHQSLYMQARSAHVLAFSFAPAARLAQWITTELDAQLPPAWRAHTRFVPDPDRIIYHRYGLGRNSPLRVYGPRILWHYGVRFLRGQGIPRVREDPLQKGGDFVVDRRGRIALSHVGKDQADRPAVSAILAALAAAA